MNTRSVKINLKITKNTSILKISDPTRKRNKLLAFEVERFFVPFFSPGTTEIHCVTTSSSSSLYTSTSFFNFNFKCDL